MKRIVFIVAIVSIGFFAASCGPKEKLSLEDIGILHKHVEMSDWGGITQPGYLPEPDWRNLEVVEVVEGDLITVSIKGVEEPCRLIGIDAPGRGEPGFTEATRALAEIVGGRRVDLISFDDPLKPPQKDENGCLRFFVLLPDEDETGAFYRIANALMVKEGWAKYSTRGGYNPFPEQFEKYEAEAKAAKRGIWGEIPDKGYSDWDPRLYPLENVQIVRVTGPDEVIAVLDGKEERCALAFVDVPKKDEPEYEIAVDFLKWFLSLSSDAVFWFPELDERDSSGRLVVRIEIQFKTWRGINMKDPPEWVKYEIETEDANLFLIRTGFAKCRYTIALSILGLEDKYRAAEGQAKAEKQGIWAEK